MENFIIGLFSEQLSTYIHGFRKEQVNASLLSGKGEISEVHVNVDPINELLADLIPYIELASVYVSKLSFNVTSIRNIRKAPIEISVDEVHVVLVERLKYTHGNQTWAEFVKEHIEAAKKFGSYGLSDRIRDNITIDVNRIYVTFQPLGKFKTRKIGPWTPPAISLVLNHLRVATVDEYGEEGSPDDVWRHNSRLGRQENAIRYRNSDNSKSERTYRSKTNIIFKKVSFELSVGMGYRRKKGMSAKQTFLNSDVMILTNLPMQCHMAMHRRLRDNALLALQVDMSMTTMEVVVESETLPLIIHALTGLEFCFIKDRAFIDPLDDGEVDESLLLLNDALPSYKINNEDGLVTKTSEEDVVDAKGGAETKTDQFDDVDSDEEGTSNDIGEDSSVFPPPQDSERSDIGAADDEQCPAFVLPSGMIISEKFCVSLSIHTLSVRAVYNSKSNGYLQCTIKGLVSEFICPRSKDEHGGFVQLSLSHVNIHESYHDRIHILINGGNILGRDMDKGNKGKLTTKEESFPIMEPRDVRNDPMDTETAYPTQALCLKASINLLEKESSFSLSSPKFVLLEIGVNTIELNYYPAMFDRATDFFWKFAAEKFEYKWFSGDWQDNLPDGAKVDIEQCIQPLPEVITREYKLSTKNFNMTLKTSDFKFRIPAPMSVNVVKCSDIVMKISDFTFIAASGLPREFLSDEIFGSEEKIMFSDSSTNIRIQVNMNGFQIEVMSSPLYGSTKDPQKVLYFRALTFLGSYDRLKVEHSEEQFYLFLTLQLHHVQLNIDFDVLFGAVSTIKHMIASYSRNGDSSEEKKEGIGTTVLSKLPEEFKVDLRLSLSKVDFRVWRQNIPVATSHIVVVPYMPLIHFDIENLELGAKGNLKLFTAVEPGFHLTFIALQFAKLRLSVFELVKKKNYENEIDKSGLLTSPEFKEIVIAEMGENQDSGQKKGTGAFSFFMKNIAKSTEICAIDVQLMKSTFWIGTEIENVFLSVLEAALDPAWIGLLLRNVDEEDTEEISKGNKKSTQGFTSMNISIISHIKLNDLMVAVPLQGEEEALLLVCEKSDLSLGYLTNTQETSKIWLESFVDNANGFHAKVVSRQKVVQTSYNQLQKKELTNASKLIESFEVSSYLHPLHSRSEIQNIKATTKDIVALSDLSDNFSKYKSRIDNFNIRVSKMLTPLQKKYHEKNVKSDIPDGPITMMCDSSKESIEKARLLVEEMNTSVSALKEKIGDSFLMSENEVNKSRALLFKKEIERFSAFALLTNTCSGYLQMGSTAIGSQRIVSLTNFWRYWVVVKRTTMILFNNPDDAVPIESFSLDGAKLCSIIGGNTTRRNLMKGFAILDAEGTKRFFIASTYAHFEKWVQTLSNILPSDEMSRDPSIQDNNEGKGMSNENNSSGNKIDIQQQVHPTIGKGSVIVESSDHKKSNLRDKARNRMSKIGSAVKNNVRIDKNAIRSASFPKIGRKADTMIIPQSNDQRDSTSNIDIERGKESGSYDDDISNPNDSQLEEQVSDETSVPDTQLSLSEDIQSSFDNTIDEGGSNKLLNLRDKAKGKMSILGSAVKNNGHFPKINLKIQPNNNSRLSEPPSMKVRGLRHDLEEPQLKEDIVHKDQKMCSLLGIWDVNVTSDKDSSSGENISFTIKLTCRQWTSEGIEKPADIILKKSISALLKFHAEISAALTTIASDLKTAGLTNQKKEQKNHVFAQVLHSGRLITGLLRIYDGKLRDDLLSIVCETMQGFLWSLLADPLPSYPSTLLIEFMEMTHIGIKDLGSVIPSDEYCESKNTLTFDCDKEFSHILALVESSKVAISHAEQQSLLASRLSKEVRNTTKLQLETPKSSSHLQLQHDVALHNALMTVMAERDGAQSQLMAERIFHMHELDQERRKVDVLEKKVEVLKRVNNEDSVSAAAFFLGTEEVPNKNSLGKIEKTMVQNVDAELMELCRQLSSEISTRVSTELEILRLKESRRIEIEAEKREREILNEELKVYKKKMEDAISERNQFKVETEKWKSSFETVISQKKSDNTH